MKNQDPYQIQKHTKDSIFDDGKRQESRRSFTKGAIIPAEEEQKICKFP